MLKRTFHNYGYEYRHSYGLFLKGGTFFFFFLIGKENFNP